MKTRRRFKQLLVLGLGLAVLAASAAQAATRPDDRSGPLGVGTAALQSATIRPDDRAGPLGVGTVQVSTDASDVISRYLVNHPAAVRPDDRAGPFGVGTDVISRYLVNHPAAVRPDDRGGIRGVGTGSAGIVTSAPNEGGFSWDVVGLAAGSVLGALAIALAGFALVHRRRSATAALQS